MKRFLPAIATASLLTVAGTTHAAVLVSSALDNSQTDITGSDGIFSGTIAGDASAAVAGVTTTVLSSNGSLNGKFASGTTGPKSVTLRAVSAANGMDLTYDVTYSPFRYDAVNGDVATSTRRAGNVTVSSSNGNPDRAQTTANGDGIEFWRVTIDNVVNSGATTFFLDGAVTLRFNGLSAISVSDTYVGGVTGTVLGTGGTGTTANVDTDIALDSPATSFAIVATADDLVGTRADFENRWEGLAVQFNDVPEPGSLALLGLGGLLIAVRRRRHA